MDITNGKIRWRIPFKSRHAINAADPLFINDTVFISAAYKFGCGLYRIKGNEVAEVWRNKNLNNHFTSSIHVDGFIYGLHGDIRQDPTFNCLDIKDGSIKWEHKNAGPFIKVKDHFLMISVSGTLKLLKADNKGIQVVDEKKVQDGDCWTQPLYANGQIFVRNTPGKLRCYE